jgi:glycosyltransferase involved in cell wall biosynthesis/SAM-dependent methyltransferase
VKRILLISPFPPLRDGVGKYAAQEAAALRAEGHEVEILSPLPCAAHYVEDLKGGLRLLKVLRYANRFDRILLQYQPSLYHKSRQGLSRGLSNLAMLLLFRSIPNITVVCHEVEYPDDGERRPSLQERVERLAWEAASEVVFHTEWEREAMKRRLGATPRRVVVRPHGVHFRPALSEDRETARKRLGLPQDETLFVSIGFIQPHKGFDRAIRAFRRIPGEGIRLIVVGSVRTGLREHHAYFDSLLRLAKGERGVEVRKAALTDEEFDRWVIASDAVVLPYREIWSSGVLERAKLLDRRVITTNVGGLAEQVRDGDVVAANDRELAEAMARLVGREIESPGTMSVEAAWDYLESETESRRVGSGPEDAERWRGPRVDATTVERLQTLSSVHRAVIRSPRPVIGPLITLAKRLIRRPVGWSLDPVVDHLSDFQSRAVQAIVDLDRELESVREATAAIRDDLGGLALRQAEADRRDSERLREFENVTTDLDQAAKRLIQVERSTRALVAGAVNPTAPASRRKRSPATSSAEDYTTVDYFRFEDRHRGDQLVIKQNQKDNYLKEFIGQGPVLDVGCGRGEFLEVLGEAGVEARGVDINLDMVAECRDKGLEVEHAEALAYLGGLTEGTLGGIFAAQFVEHLPPRGIVDFLAGARRALRLGGIIVCETINPQCLFALANWYVMDLTHKQPVHPDTFRLLLEQEGFDDVEVRYFSPVREEPPPIELGEEAPAWAQMLAKTLSEELSRFNSILFGPQDYAAIGRIP